MTKFKGKPDEFCPKCGFAGFKYAEPRYRSMGLGDYPTYYASYSHPTEEWLEWACTTCDYKVVTRVLIEVQ